MSLNLVVGLLGVAQLVWLFLAWRKSGFLAALNLFLYSVLSSMAVVLSYYKDGQLVL